MWHYRLQLFSNRCPELPHLLLVKYTDSPAPKPTPLVELVSLCWARQNSQINKKMFLKHHRDTLSPNMSTSLLYSKWKTVYKNGSLYKFIVFIKSKKSKFFINCSTYSNTICNFAARVFTLLEEINLFIVILAYYTRKGKSIFTLKKRDAS